MVKPLHLQETSILVVCRIHEGQVQEKGEHHENYISKSGKPIINQLEVEGIKESVCVGKSTRSIKGNDLPTFNQSVLHISCARGDPQKTSLSATRLKKIPKNEIDYGKEYWRMVIFLSVLQMQALSWMKRRFRLGSNMMKLFLSIWKPGVIQLNGIKGKRKHIFCLILMLLGTPSAGSDCPTESVSTIKEVKSCPLTKKDHEEAARKMNCSGLVSPDCSDLEYHCLVNGFGNGTIEVCAKGILVQKEYCAEFNKRGMTIQNSQSVKPENPPGEHYQSREAYKYPECYKSILPITNVPTLLSTTENTNELTTTQIFENDTKPMEEEKPNKNYTWVAAVVVGLILPCVIVAVLILLCNILHSKGTTEDVEVGIEASNTDQLLNGATEDVEVGIEASNTDQLLNGRSDGSRHQENSPVEYHPCMNGTAK